MALKELIDATPSAMVEFYDNTEACAAADASVKQVGKELDGKLGVFRVNVTDNPREAELMHITVVPTVIIYRNGREEWRLEGDIPDAQTLKQRLEASAL